MNSRLFKGNMHFQALGTNFRVWSDGIVSPLYEELPSTAQLIALEYDDVEGRHALMHDPLGRGVPPRLAARTHRRRLGELQGAHGLPDHLVIRDLHRLVFDGAPVPTGTARPCSRSTSACCASRTATPTAGALGRRARGLRRLRERPRRRRGLHALPDAPLRQGLPLLGGRVERRQPHATIDYLLHPQALPGFNDSGAHITNMAFFDGNLMSLKLAQEQGDATVAKVVRRLTREPAEFFGLDVGTLESAPRPTSCSSIRRRCGLGLQRHARVHLPRSVRAPPDGQPSRGIVREVMIRGDIVWEDGDFTGPRPGDPGPGAARGLIRPRAVSSSSTPLPGPPCRRVV
jgi:hypothetical protein